MHTSQHPPILESTMVHERYTEAGNPTISGVKLRAITEPYATYTAQNTLMA